MNVNLLNYIDGKGLYVMFLAGANRILQNQVELNKINVFPVPDSDTGTNLASTVRTIIEQIKGDKEYKHSANEIAEAALEGARGNSGVIFAQFLHGLRKETTNMQKVNLHDFAVALNNSVKYVYDAISNPVEGTMITVIREWSEYFYNNRFSKKKFYEVFSDSIDVAKRSLVETTQKLKVLAKANVVDAGAKGFVLFLEGILELFKSLNLKKLLSFSKETAIEETTLEHIDEDIEFSFCTEAIIKGKDLDHKMIRSIAEKHGNSVVVAGSESKARLHVHTNHPADLFFKLKSFGVITNQKADNMRLQTEIAHHKKYNIALVTDSTCDLPQELIDKYQIHVVPLKLNIGESDYLDKTTIHPKQLYNLLDNIEQYPQTAQPSLKSFENTYSFLSSHYDSIISLHLSGDMSGTLSVAEKAASKIEKETGKKISVINSKYLSGALGILVYRVAEAIEKQQSHDSLLSSIDEWIEKLNIFVSVKTLKYMVRSGRVSSTKGWVAKKLNINPIVSIKDGKSQVFGQTFSQRSNMRKVIKHVKKLSEEKRIWNSVILHANNQSSAEWYSKEITKLSGKKPIGILNISPVVGVNVGIGAASVAYMYE